MSIERVQRFLAEHAPETTVTVLAKNTATVALAAEAFGVEGGQIAKTLSFRVNHRIVANCLDIMAIRGDHKCRIVVGMVMGP